MTVISHRTAKGSAAFVRDLRSHKKEAVRYAYRKLRKQT